MNNNETPNIPSVIVTNSFPNDKGKVSPSEAGSLIKTLTK